MKIEFPQSGTNRHSVVFCFDQLTDSERTATMLKAVVNECVHKGWRIESVDAGNPLSITKGDGTLEAVDNRRRNLANITFEKITVETI